MGSLTSHKLSHSPQCSLHFPTCLLCLSSCLSPKPPYYLGKPYHLLILSSNATVSMPPLRRAIPSYLSSLSSFFVLLGKCFHTLCFLFHPFLILKCSAVRNSYSSHITPRGRNSINIYWVNGTVSLNLLSQLIKATINSNHTGFRTSCTAQLQRALFSLPTM